MKERQMDEISENALLLFPLVKRLFKGDARAPAVASLRNQTYHILRILERKGSLPVSTIGNQLFIAKQNMTTLIDRLMNDRLVERKDDTADRRIVNIVITKKGERFLKGRRLTLKRIVRDNLSKLSDKEIELLHSAFQVIRTIVHKME